MSETAAVYHARAPVPVPGQIHPIVYRLLLAQRQLRKTEQTLQRETVAALDDQDVHRIRDLLDNCDDRLAGVRLLLDQAHPRRLIHQESYHLVEERRSS